MKLWSLFLLTLCPVNAVPHVRSLTSAAPKGQKSGALARQASPVNSALTGLFAPPFIVMVSLGAFAHTVEKFVTDMVRPGRNVIRRRKKKPAHQQEIKPFPPLPNAARPPPPPPPPQAPAPVSAPDEESEITESSAPGRYRWRFFENALLRILKGLFT